MSDSVHLSSRKKIEIAAFIGAFCLLAIVLQNGEGWHRKYVLSEIDPELLEGQISSISLLPSNTGTTYVIGVDLETGEKARLIASLGLAKSCKVGQTIEVKKRGLDYRFSDKRCDYE